jgi:hypothetical protein
MSELATKADLRAMEQRLRNELRTTDIRARFEILTLRLTIRLGIMWLVAMWAAVIIVKLTKHAS